MRKLNRLSKDHIWFASILLFFVLGCLVMKSCIWDEIQANKPAQQTELETDMDSWVHTPIEGLLNARAALEEGIPEALDALEKEITALAHEIAAIEEEIERDLEDLILVEAYLRGK